MRIIFTLFCFLFFTITSFSQSETDILKRANDLIADKKYESAFRALQDFDTANIHPDIVLLKEDIVINYFVVSMMHQMFSLKDIEKHENIMDYRGKENSASMIVFQVNDILDNLIKQYPKNYKLYKGLGDFYYDVQQRYGTNWLKDDETLTKLIIQNYKTVIDHDQADYQVQYKVGFEYLNHEKNKESIPYFLESIKLKSDFADASYNLAYAYLFIGKKEKALMYAKNSIGMYTDKGYKSDAARMTGQIYAELKDETKAIEYLELANSIDPNNYYNLKSLLFYYVKREDKKAGETMNQFYQLAPEKPTIYNDLKGIFTDEKKSLVLIDFYKSKILKFTDNKIVSGNLCFALGQLYLAKDKKIAKDYFLKAKELFKTVYNKDNQVFPVIEAALKQTE